MVNAALRVLMAQLCYVAAALNYQVSQGVAVVATRIIVSANDVLRFLQIPSMSARFEPEHLSGAARSDLAGGMIIIHHDV